MKTTISLVMGSFALCIAGCTMAPKFVQPEAPVPDAWPGGAAYADSIAAAEAPSAPDLDWREFVTDEKLKQVIELALANNRDLRRAALNVELARAYYGIQRNELFPSVDAVAGASKQRASADLTQPGQPRTTERYDVNLGMLSWELDFFGRIRSLKDRALDEYLATEQARRGAQILLVSSLAEAWLALSADRENLALAENTLQSQQAAYDLVQRRYESGVVSELDLRRAQTPLETARRDIARYTQLVMQDENALQLLAGAPVPGSLLPAGLGLGNPFREFAAGLRSDVLLRRPDVLQAEYLLKASNANIGAARAAFFPRISLTSLAGTASNELSGLFSGGTGTWSFSSQAVMPVFDARTWSGLKITQVQKDLAIAQYERAIQSAFREAADALALRGTIDTQVSAQQSLVEAVAETYRLSNERYIRGIDSYLGVLDAQRSHFAAQQGLVLLRMAKLANQVRLYAVLGGGGEQPATAAGEE